MNKKTKDSIIIGFALFAMFFGAGNLIFPPYLGNMVGDKFFIAMIGFVLTGVGLPLLAILACSKGDGSLESIASRISPKFAIILASVIFIAIGPMLGIPRTAATTYELAIQPYFPEITPFISMIIYFGINLIFVLRRSSIIDTIGKFLTPVLILILSTIVIKGIFTPIGEIISTDATSVLSSSLIEGYQTMDAIAALLFATIIITSIKNKGYSKEEVTSVTLRASLVAVIGLTFVYGGLMYLGTQTSSLVGAETGIEIGKTALLLLVAKGVLGDAGGIMIGLAMGVACLTTSIGLLTAGATFFEKVSKGKLPYKVNAIVIALISVVIGSLGVDNIVVISGPILNILYPVAITLIFSTLLRKYITNVKAAKVALSTAFTFGLLSEIAKFTSLNLEFLPFNDAGFVWLLPTLVMFTIVRCLTRA
ncbi:MAG: branched-chain amino acid transport system II carrier protein [Clostridium sp.]